MRLILRHYSIVRKRAAVRTRVFEQAETERYRFFQWKRLSDVTCYIAGKLYAFADERSEEALCVEFYGILTILEKGAAARTRIFELAEDTILLMIEAGTITISIFKRSKPIL